MILGIIALLYRFTHSNCGLITALAIGGLIMPQQGQHDGKFTASSSSKSRILSTILTMILTMCGTDFVGANLGGFHRSCSFSVKLKALP